MTDRFTNPQDKAWYEKTIITVAGQHLGEEYVPMVSTEPYFVDFLRDAPEPTGDEPDDADMEAPKIYELVMTNTSLPFYVDLQE